MLRTNSVRQLVAVAMLLPWIGAAAKPAAKSKKGAAPASGPGLKDSIAFLKEKVETYGTYSYEVEKTDPPTEKGKVTGSAKIGSFDEKGCVLEIRRQVALETAQDEDPAHTYSETSEVTLKIPLRDLDATKVTVENLPATFRKVYNATGDTTKYLQLTVVGKEGKSPIKVVEKRTMKDPTAEKKTEVANLSDNAPTTYIMFSDSDVADRAQKALQHAVELCQKKKEAF